MARLTLALLLLVGIFTGCAPRHYSLLRDGSRELLLPPGMRSAPVNAAAPEADCSTGTPTTPRASHYSLYGCYVRDGFVDLRAGMRLKIVKPVLPAGETLRNEVVAQEGLNLNVRSNVLGAETKYVEVLPSAAPGGVRVDLGFAPAITHYRLFFLARESERGRKITLVGGSSAADLERATQGLEDYCGVKGAPCLAVSEGMVIGAQMAVSVRGKTEYFPLGAHVGETVEKGVQSPAVTLKRQWRGKPAMVRPTGPEAPSPLSLPLNGGDSVSW